jgi:predicted amidohydrolase
MPIKILLAQLNCTVGDLTGNGEKISNALEKAKVDGADIVVTPELAISGYPPEDLLLREDFLKGCDLELESLRAKTENITVVVGHPYR